MNLRETIRALEQSNIEVALDLGAHRFCTIDSNCPMAIELRRVMGASGITVEQLSAGLLASQEPDPEPLSYELPEIDGNVVLRVGDHRVQVDMTNEIRDQLDRVYSLRMAEYSNMEERLRNVGGSLYQSYLHAIDETKSTKTLPQLDISMADVIKYQCLITTDNRNYLILFPIEYKPQWIWSHQVRYQLAPGDMLAIMRVIYMVFPVSGDYKILTPYLVDRDTGAKFQHYHGRGGDCWGDVTLPQRWDGSLASLAGVAYQLQAALATINRDSLMTGHPVDMPDALDLMDRSTRLGREGVVDTPEEVVVPEDGVDVDRDRFAEEVMTQPTTDPNPRRWGRRG